MFICTGFTQSVAVDNIEQCSMPSYNGNTLYVGGTGEGNYSKIQDAINDSSDGDTIFVFGYSSPYYEHIRINKSINLIGEDSETTVIDGGGESRDVVRIFRADEIYINGFTIQKSNSSSLWYAGISLFYSDFTTITGNTITNNRVGIYLEHSDRNNITGNTISNHYNQNGITVDDSHDNNIMGNTISNNHGGVGVFDSHGNTIQKNNFLNNTRQALFQNSFVNKWYQNYWNEPRILPKLIFGVIFLSFIYIPILIPWFNIDLRPARKPYDIDTIWKRDTV